MRGLTDIRSCIRRGGEGQWGPGTVLRVVGDEGTARVYGKGKFALNWDRMEVMHVFVHLLRCI